MRRGAMGLGRRSVRPIGLRLGWGVAMVIAMTMTLGSGLIGGGVARAGVVISEIHYHPVEEPAFNTDGTPVLDLTDDIHEFIEIQNAGEATVDLGGWTLAGGVNFTFPTNTTIAPGGFRVIAKNPGRLATVYSLVAAEIFGPYSGLLGNNSDTVRLRDAAGNLVDAVTYASRFPWPASADALGAQDRFTGLTSASYQYKGRSLQRVSVTWASSDPANWLASPLTGPTPGGPQAVTRVVPKPLVTAFSAVQTSDGATIVRPGNAVTVNCTLSATNGLGAVTLEYFVDDVNSTTETRTTVAMTTTDGLRFTGTIPGQTTRSIVRYRFRADRGDGSEVVSPRADDPQIAPVGTGGAREAWHGYFVTPVRTTSNAAIYDVLVSTSGLSTMSANITQTPKRVTVSGVNGLPRDVPYVAASAPQWDGTVAAVFACNGELWDIQLRYHGSIYHRSPTNASYKVHFPSHHPFNGQSSWFETLHGTEFIEAQRMNRLLGLPASKMRRVDWYFNATANTVHSEQGEYAAEMLDEYHALQQQLNPGTKREASGELYKDVGNRDPSQNNNEGPYTRGDMAPLAANSRWSQLDRYAWTFSLQCNGWKGSKPIRDLIEGMWTARGDTPSTHNFANNATSLARTRDWFTNNWDVDRLLTSVALLQWMSIWDDGAQNQFFWRRASGQWVRLGWDYDNVMATSSGGGGGGGMGGSSTQTIYGGEYGAPTVFDGVNWWKDTFYKCFRTEYTQRLWELNNSFCDPTNLTALGFSRAATFGTSRRTYVNTQLSSFGTYTKPNRPSNSAPSAGATVLSSGNLVTTAFTHAQSVAHASTKWEIRTAAGDYEEPLLAVTSTNALTSFPIPFDQLTYGQTYYWRATHIDANGHPSVVSAETAFTWGTTSAAAGALVLNELLAENRAAVENGGRHPDYIELFNNSATNITLTGYALTDDPLQPARFTFPAGATIAAGGYYLVWCDADTAAPGVHSGFGLSAAGQTVVLLKNGTVVDSVTFGPQAPDVSIGRIVNGTGGWQANAPTPLTANSARTLGAASGLRINEWMADPAYGEDWFELYNPGDQVVSLAGLYLSDTPASPLTTKIGSLSFIEPHGFTRFWADGSSAGGNRCNFKLEKNGETLVLTAVNGVTTIDTVTFSVQTSDVAQGRLPDGSATIVSFADKTASPGGPNWRPSAVRINEVLAHAAAPFEGAIELFNPTASPVDVGGWWLSDDPIQRQKYQFPGGMVIPAGGYRVVYADALAAGVVPWQLNPRGGEVRLSEADASGALTGYGRLVRFGASAENTAFGWEEATGLNSTSGNAEFWPRTRPTFGQDQPANVAVFRTGTGAANAEAQTGPVLINELMYHPAAPAGAGDNTRDELIELANATGTALSLAGWRLHGDVEFVFPTGATLAANGYALVVSFDPADTASLGAFLAAYGLPGTTAVFGPYDPKLANSTFDVELAYPLAIDGWTSYVNVDKVEYRDTAPWPTTPDGTGTSLQRISSRVIGDTAANWSGQMSTPGALNTGVAAPLAIETPALLPGALANAVYSLNLVATGGSSPFTWKLIAGAAPGLTLDDTGLLHGTAGAPGTYGLTLQVTDQAGAVVSQPCTLVIAATAPAIATASPLAGATVGTAYNLTMAGAGGTAPYAWSVATGELPEGLALNAAGGLTGTPTTASTATFTIRLADAGGLAVEKAFQLTVTVAPLIITTASPLVSAQPNVAYSQAIQAAGGVAPYTWLLAGGALPEGLKLNDAGEVTGIPTTPGTASFTVRVTDHAGTSLTKTFALTVAVPTLTIVTVQLPDGELGAAYSGTLAASGGTAPYSWALTWGDLPEGLQLSSAGVLSGAARRGGTFSFIVEVTDHNGATAQAIYTVAIRNHEPVMALAMLPEGTVRIEISGDAGPTYTIESSTDLETWETRVMAVGPAMPWVWTDTSVTSGGVFYRVSLTP